MKIDTRGYGETARAYAYRVIRENIISLDLEPGSPFNDMEFSRRIGISRTPVREAVIQLSEESRIIEVFPQKGMRIALIDVDLVEEARFLRLLLEKAVAELACDMAVPEDIEQLRENVKLQNFYMEEGSPKKLLELDNEMHRILFVLCRKELTYNMCRRLAIHYDRIRSLSVNTVKDRTIIEDHRELIEAIAAKDKKNSTPYKIDSAISRATAMTTETPVSRTLSSARSTMDSCHWLSSPINSSRSFTPSPSIPSERDSSR